MWILAHLRDYPPIIAHFCATLRNNAHLRDHPPIIACPRATLRSIAPPRAPFHMFLTLCIHQTMFAPPRWCAKTPCFIARRGTNLQHLRSWWLSFATLNTSLEIYESHIVVYYCILDIIINLVHISYLYTHPNTKIKIIKTLTKTFTKIVSSYRVVKPRRGTFPECIVILYLVTKSRRGT